MFSAFGAVYVLEKPRAVDFHYDENNCGEE